MNKLKTTLKQLGIALMLQFVLYGVQFLHIPVCYMPHPEASHVNTFIIYSTTIVIVLFGQIFLVKNIWCWIVTFLIYPILVKIYHPKDLYGIGYDGYVISFNENFDIIFLATLILIIEILACIVANVLRWWKGRKSSK